MTPEVLRAAPGCSGRPVVQNSDVSAPTGIVFPSKKAESITVQWNATNLQVIGYRVFYRKKSDSNSWRTKDVGNTTVAVLEGLKPYTVYLVQVLVNTTSGTSNKSDVVEVRTDEALPSAFPKITRIKATSSSIDLEWDAIPKDAENGRLLGYNVYYVKHTDVADFLNKYKQLYVNISSRQATITGLKSYTIYYVGVAAFNSKGFAHQLVTISQVNTFRTKEGAPSTPSGLTAHFTASSKLSVSWTLLPSDKTNGVIHGYRYIVYNMSDTEVFNRTVSNTTNAVNISNLVLCTGYVIHVAAWTGAGPGNYSIFSLSDSCGPPKITKFHPRVIAALYSLVVLPCDYTASPKPTSVSWVLKSGKVLTSGTREQHIIFMPGGTRVLTKNITFYRNGSLVISFVEHTDKGIYTCRVTSRKGSVSANTTLIVSGGAESITFELYLTGEQYDDDLKNKQSSRYERLSTEIKSAVRTKPIFVMIRRRTVPKVYSYGKSQGVGSVIVLFSVTATFNSSQNKHDVIADILDTMVTSTQSGKLGSLSVGNLTVSGAAPPPPTDLSVESLQPTYVVLRWKSPKHDKIYEINGYGMQYRKHGDSNYKSVKNVQEVRGVLQGLDPGERYVVRIISHRKGDYDVKHSRGISREIITPNPLLKQVLLTIVLPIVLALIIVFLIICVFRKLCREETREDNLVITFTRPDGHREENPYDIGRLLEEFPCRWKEIPRSDLKIGKELGAGAFGSVVRADLKLNDHEMPCAVKMLKAYSTEREHRDLFNELSIMSQVGYHPNVINLLGACTVNGPLWLVVKIAENGSLHDYLHKHRKPDYMDHSYMNVSGSSNQGDQVQELDKLQKLKFAHGISKGMSYLAKNKCVHRDLAARNVLLGKHLVAMVSDFGLARDIYESGMYEDVRGGKRPVRWMAPESIEDYMCTTKSDVWSFGVTLWEIETAGTVPYAGVDSGMDILNEVKKGYRLEKPNACDDDVYEVMLSTWRPNPLDRPTFQNLTAVIEEMLTGISEYLEIQPEDEYQEAFTSPYDEVQIDTTDLEENNDETTRDVPNGNLTSDDNPGTQHHENTVLEMDSSSLSHI
ncbi:hypothetical protein QZH41_011745 [Actinostola sp. cb2023]|nr:hypothetical protein QZH41_011745 [Actinostola sp. cb2023]